MEKILKNKEKYAMLVFEIEIPEEATNEEIVMKMKEHIEKYIKDGIVSIDDMEINERPYER